MFDVMKKLLAWFLVLSFFGVMGCATKWNLNVEHATLGTLKWPLVKVVAVVDVDAKVDIPLADGVLDFLFAGLFGEEGPPAPTAAEIAEATINRIRATDMLRVEALKEPGGG